MRPRLLIGLAFLILGVGLAFTYSQLLSQKSAEFNGTPAAIKPSQLPLSSLREIAKQPRLRPQGRLEVGSAIDPACARFWTELQKLDLQELSYPPKLDHLPNPAGCRQMPQELVKLHADYQKNCAEMIQQIAQPASEDEWGKKIAGCMVQLYFLRAGITSVQTRDQPLSDITDLKVLVDRLTYEFSKIMGQQPKPAGMVAVAERMLELDPRLFGAAKAALIGGILLGVDDASPQRDSDDYWNKMAAQLDHASELNPNDPELAEMHRLIRTHGFKPELVKADAEGILATQPNSVLAHRLRGFAEWRMGNRNAAYQALQEAMALDPNNAELKKIWNDIHAPGADAKSYPITAKFGINLDSILR